MSDEPEYVASIDLRAVKAYITTEDGDLVLRVHDGDVGVQLESGMGGRIEQAILGAERIASMAEQYAALLRVQVGNRAPLTPWTTLPAPQ